MANKGAVKGPKGWRLVKDEGGVTYIKHLRCGLSLSLNKNSPIYDEPINDCWFGWLYPSGTPEVLLVKTRGYRDIKKAEDVLLKRTWKFAESLLSQSSANK